MSRSQISVMWEEEWNRMPESNGLERIDTSESVGANKRQKMVLAEVRAPVAALQGKRLAPDDEE
jgi:hypothetical protein